jgi:hypothetical protein
MNGLDDSKCISACGVNCNSNNNTAGSSFNLISLRKDPNQHGNALDDECNIYKGITDLHMERFIDILDDAIQIVDEVFLEVSANAEPSSSAVTTTLSAPGAEAGSATATFNPSENETSSHVQDHSGQGNDSYYILVSFSDFCKRATILEKG